MADRESYIERLLHRIEQHMEDWQHRTTMREEELQAHRSMLWADGAEREKMLVQQVAEEEEAKERSLEQIAKDHRVAFVVHSEEVGEALKEFASKRACLVNVVPANDSDQRGEDIKGSWLVFE